MRRMLKVFCSNAGSTLALFILLSAKAASTNFSVIFYQGEIPEKVKALK